MSVSELVASLSSRIKKRATEKRTTIWQRYRDELLKPLAAGQKVSDDLAEEILAEMDRSPEQLAADVEKFSKRLADAATVATKADWERRLKEATALREKLNAEFEAMKARLSPQIKAAWDAERAAEVQISVCGTAEGHLAQSVMDPSIAEREEPLRQQMQEVINEIQRLTERRRELTEHIESNQEKLNSPAAKHHPATVSNAKDWLARQLPELKQIDERISKLEAERSRINAAVQALHAEKLVP